MYEIKTSNYYKSRKILVDGMEWTMHPPGAGDELALNQAKRRSELLERKIQNGTATEEDYDTYDRLENHMYKIFGNMFRDGTPDNAQVATWISDTPLAIIMAIFEDIKKQTEQKAQDETEQPQVS